MSPLNISLLVLAFCLLLQCGDVKPNPGPINPGYEAMVDCAQEIVSSLSTDPKGLAFSLFSKRFISRDVLEQTNELNETKTDKARRLYTEILKIVEQCPKEYMTFVGTLEDQKQCDDIVLKLGLRYTYHVEEDARPREVIAQESENGGGIVRSDSLAASVFSSPPTSPMSLSSASSRSSSLTESISMRSSEEKILNALRKTNLASMDQYFSNFTASIARGFTEDTCNIEGLRNALKFYYGEMPLLQDIWSVFKYLIDNQYWDCFNNYEHLLYLIDTYGNGAMKKEKEGFRNRRESFAAATKLHEFLSGKRDLLSYKPETKGRSTKRRRSSKEYRDKLAVKLNIEISGSSLKYIDDLWSRLSYLGLSKIGVVLDSIIAGCIHILWTILLPIIALDFRKKATQPEAAEFFKNNKIVQVILNDDCIYSAEDLTSSITNKLPTSESIEEEPAELSGSEEPGETQDKDAVIVEEETSEEKESMVKDVADEVKGKGKDTVVSDEPVESAQPAKEQSTGVLSKFVRKIKEKSLFKKKTISDKLLAECRSKTADIEVVRGYLEQEDCDVNIRENDDFKWSSLMWALENKHFEIGRLLLKYKPQVHIQDKKEWSPLVLASRAGDLEIVQGIVALGAEIDLPTNLKWTPLMWAAQEGHAEVARFLLEKGSFVDFPDENGWTPLMQASQEGHVGVINILLDHNAKINHQTETTWCALMAAAKNMHSDAVDTLLKRGAQVDIQRDDGSTTLQVASYYKGNSDVMKTLIKHGTNIDHLNKDGMTALMLATTKGHLGVVQDLIEGGADTNKQHPETGWTPIFFAAKSGKIDIFKELLYKGARTEIEGRNVVDVASMFKRGRMLSELKTFEQASHRIISSSVNNPPSLEAAEPTPIEQEPSFITEPKVEIPPEVTKPQQKLAEDSKEEVKMEPPQLPDPEAVKPSLSTTEAKEKEVPAVEAVTEQTSQTSTTEQIKKSSEAKKDTRRQAEIIDLLLKGLDQRMANPQSNMYPYKKPNFPDVIGGMKGVKSSEEITHKPLSGIITTTSTTTTQRGFIRVDPDEELYS